MIKTEDVTEGFYIAKYTYGDGTDWQVVRIDTDPCKSNFRVWCVGSEYEDVGLEGYIFHSRIPMPDEMPDEKGAPDETC